jgi:hypothetical protein
MFDMPLEYGGIMFPDGACATKFPVAGRVGDAARAEFAACLASVPLALEARETAIDPGAMLVYAPGFELAADFSPAPAPKLRRGARARTSSRSSRWRSARP